MNKIFKNHIIRGINIFWYYKNNTFLYYLKKYFKYINNIQITFRYNKKNNFLKFKKILYLCIKYKILLTINIRFTKNNFFKYIKYIKIFSKLKIVIFKIKNIYFKNIYEWYFFYKKIFYILKKKNIKNLLLIDYPNKIGYPNYIIIKIIKKLLYKKNIILVISLNNIKYNNINNIIYLTNCMLNINILICFDKINYINNLQFLLNYCQKKRLGWFIIPKKKKYILEKNYFLKFKNFKINIINCKNGIRQTSIKYFLKPY